MPKTASKLESFAEAERDFRLRAPEISVWMACFGLTNELRTLDEKAALNLITSAQFSAGFNKILGQLREAADITHRFDIILPVQPNGTFSSFFWRWFNWWNDYILTLTPTQVSHLELLASSRVEAVNLHRPAGSWIDYRSTPLFSVERI